MDRGWRVRIDSDTGQVRGAGFLVDEVHVLTCAHVVEGLADVQVIFPGMAVRQGAVERLTDWAIRGDRGDVALVQLKDPIELEAAPLAELACGDESDPTRNYGELRSRALGFGPGFDDNGSYVTIYTKSDMLLANEWQQINVDRAQGEVLGTGFSGAAVSRVDTGEVIGMVTDADLARGGPIGLMLPLKSLRYYWDDLDQLLRLPWLEPGERRDLHDIVRHVQAPCLSAYRQAFGYPAPTGGFRSAWGAIRYVVEERVEEDRLPRFLGTLADQLPVGATRRRLTTWVREKFGDTAGILPAQLPSIIIRLDRHRDTFGLTLATLVNGVAHSPIEPVEVPEAEVRGAVEERFPKLLPGVNGQKDWMIEFVLPEAWLGEAVEEWEIDSFERMLHHPVVVRDVTRLDPHRPRLGAALIRWETLRDGAAAGPEPVQCDGDREPQQFFDWLARDLAHCVLVFGRPPPPDHTRAALGAGMPVMLWSHAPCSASTHSSDCPGGLRARRLANKMGNARPDELPKLVWKLRLDALSRTPGDPAPYWGDRLTLFWDDPERLPDPPLMMQS